MSPHCNLLRLQQIVSVAIPDLKLSPIAIPCSAIVAMQPAEVCVPPVQVTMIELTTGRIIFVAEDLQDICERWSGEPLPHPSAEGSSTVVFPRAWQKPAFAG